MRQRPDIVPVVGQFESAGMTEHGRVGGAGGAAVAAILLQCGTIRRRRGNCEAPLHFQKPLWPHNKQRKVRRFKGAIVDTSWPVEQMCRIVLAFGGAGKVLDALQYYAVR